MFIRPKELEADDISQSSICSRLQSILRIQEPSEKLSKAETELGTTETIKRLSDLFDNTADLSNALFVLTPEEHKIAFDNSKDKFSKFITNGKEFLWVIYSFPKELRTELYNIYKDKFLELFKTAEDFRNGTSCLTSEQQAVEFNRFKGKFFPNSAAKLDSNQEPVFEPSSSIEATNKKVSPYKI